MQRDTVVHKYKAEERRIGNDFDYLTEEIYYHDVETSRFQPMGHVGINSLNNEPEQEI